MKKIITMILALACVFTFGNKGAYAIESAITETETPITEMKELPDEMQQVIDDTNYSQIMIASAINGNYAAGVQAELNRNTKIDQQGLSYSKIKFNDLFLVAKIMTAEAGCYWLPNDWKSAVGEVLLNRVASPEFPNTIEGCLYQPGQYYSRSNYFFQNLLPWETETRLAWILLDGTRYMESSVVFQANFTQGSGIYKSYYDSSLGSTYFCYSSRPNLY